MHTLQSSVGFWATAAAAAAFSLPSRAFEAKDIMAFGAGPFVVKPHLQVAELYNDNLFYGSGGAPVDDFITVISPGVDIRLGRGGGQASLGVGYAYSHLLYLDNPYIDDASMHGLTLVGAYEGVKLQFNLNASVTWANTIYGGYESFMWGGVLFLYEVPNVERFSYGVSPRASYSLSDKTSIYSNLSFSGMSFLQEYSSYYDVGHWDANLGLSYQVRPKVTMLTEFSFGQSDATPNQPLFRPKPPKPPRLDRYGGMVGVRAEVSPRLSGTIKVGYRQNEYGEESFGDPVYAGDLSWIISEKSQLTISYNRTSAASVQSATAYTADNVGLKFLQSVGTKRPWLFSAGATYGHTQYAAGTLDADADFFRVNFGVAYQIKLWLKTGLGYEFTKASSQSKSIVDYEVNEVTLSASIGY